MKNKVGLWIDHRKCIMVFINGTNVEKKIIESNAEKHSGRIHGKRSTTPFESQMVKAEDRQERHFTGQINKYFDKVISHIGDTESILIFGPGEAKHELLKHINKHKINGHLEEIESADKMTDAQIIAKVKQHNVT
ncbi:MAG: hypothetical protein JW881_07040 [Spirochaetales bacterium]|nr:hypothetical protein [Spirochaetales bacterium]